MKKGFSLLCMVLILAVTASAFALTDAEVEAAARAHVPAGAALKRIETDEGIYEASFTVEATNEKYQVKVEPDTGRVIELESKLKGAAGSKTATLDETRIAQAVRAAYPGAEVLRHDEKIDDGLHEIEVFFRAEGLYGTLELNAETGEVLERKIYFGDFQQDGMMTEEAARAALASLKPDAEITKLKLDADDGAYFWKGKAVMGGTKYEFSLNAMTGGLVEWERD